MDTLLEVKTETPNEVFDVEKFIEESKAVCKEEVNALAKLLNNEGVARKKLKWESENLVKLTSRKEILTNISIENLTDDTRSYEKDKTALRKIQTEIDVCSDAIQRLKDTVIPTLVADIKRAKDVIARELTVYCRLSLPIVNNEVNSALLTKCISPQTLYRETCRTIFANFGVKFPLGGRETLISTADKNLIRKIS